MDDITYEKRTFITTCLVFFFPYIIIKCSKAASLNKRAWALKLKISIEWNLSPAFELLDSFLLQMR
jgi:hypothetical protein